MYFHYSQILLEFHRNQPFERDIIHFYIIKLLVFKPSHIQSYISRKAKFFFRNKSCKKRSDAKRISLFFLLDSFPLTEIWRNEFAFAGHTSDLMFIISFSFFSFLFLQLYANYYFSPCFFMVSSFADSI